MIDGEELVRHTEDLISIRDEAKSSYAQRVFKLRKEVRVFSVYKYLYFIHFRFRCVLLSGVVV